MLGHTLAAAAFALVAGSAVAAPTYDTFGTLAGATFGGTGIPNDAVAIDNFGGTTLARPYSGTLGLTAFGRFGLSPVTNNGAGTFTAYTGQFDPPGTPANGALWNFGYYLNINGPFAGFARLSYDTDPGTGTNFGTITTPIVSLLNQSITLQDSQNLLFNFLYVAVPGLISPPGVAFNPDAPGTYTFRLELFQTTLANPRGTRVGLASIDVNVVPAPSSLALAALGLAIAGWVRRRRATA
jgi:hypothetical protein